MWSQILHLFFPEHCRGCRRPGRALCAHCIATIPAADNLGSTVFAAFAYGHHLVRWTIRDLKYHRKSEAARLLVRAALPVVQTYLSTISSRNIVLVPIPGHNRKVRTRGFNQSSLIAQWWAWLLPQTRVEHLLRKTVFTLPQAHLNRALRLQNVRDTMHCPTRLDPQVSYIIVDDVTTTGSTFTEAVRALRMAGAVHIYCLALAHGYAK